MKKISYALLLCLMLSWGFPFSHAGHPAYDRQAQGVYITFEQPGKSLLPADEAMLNRVPVSELPFAVSGEKGGILEPYASPLALTFSRALDGVYVVYVKAGVDIDEALERLRQDPNVQNAEKVPSYHLCSDGSPNDPYYGVYAGLDLKWHLDLIHAEEAWSIQPASEKITVAVVDNAIWGEHEDLNIPKENQYNTGTGESTSSPLDLGIDLNQNEICEQSDLDYSLCESYNWSHGTHVAGLLAADNNNGKGIASLAGGIRLLAVSAPSVGGAIPGNPYEGMRWAANHGAKVINCSWAGYSSTQTERNLVAELVAEGIIIVAGAGNSNRYDELNYPAAYPGVISVGACNADKTRARRSNYGGWVDVMAPGGQGPAVKEKVFSTTFSQAQVLPNNGYTLFEGVYYDYMEGSSMATPLVSALCALILSRDSTVTVDEMREILVSTAQKGINLGISEASGIIDAAAALKAVEKRVRRVHPEYITSFSGVCESGIAKVYWHVDPAAAARPEFLRLYKNGILVQDNLPFEAGKYMDTAAAMLANHKYELCGVIDGVESYRKEIFVSIGHYYEVKAVPRPAEGGQVFGSGRYTPNSYVRLTAEPNPGYRFVKWTYFDQWAGDSYEKPVIDFRVTQEYLGIVAVFESGSAATESEETVVLTVSPNPVSDRIRLEIPSSFQAARIVIYNSAGMQVGPSFPGVSDIDVSDLSAGLYFLRVSDVCGRTAVAKFIKK